MGNIISYREVTLYLYSLYKFSLQKVAGWYQMVQFLKCNMLNLLSLGGKMTVCKVHMHMLNHPTRPTKLPVWMKLNHTHSQSDLTISLFSNLFAEELYLQVLCCPYAVSQFQHRCWFPLPYSVCVLHNHQLLSPSQPQ